MADVEFKKILNEAIDETFAALGESPKQSIYFHLENTFALKSNEYSNNITSFDRALKDIFGPGAFLLETSILNRLTEKVMKKESPLKEEFFSYVQHLNDSWQKTQ